MSVFTKSIAIFFLFPFILLLVAGCEQSEEYEVNFNALGGSDVPSQHVKEGGAITIPTIEKEGHTLKGWYTSIDGGDTFDERWSFTVDRVHGDITLFAKWEVNDYAIHFDVMGGGVIESESWPFGVTIGLPDPVKEGHTFTGWYTDSDYAIAFNYETMPAYDVTVYAQWSVNEYTIDFKSYGGSTVDSITFQYDDAIVLPDEPEKSEHSFKGWYVDETLKTPFDLTAMPAKNLTLHAKWQPNEYMITFDTMGGRALEPDSVYYGSELFLPIPHKTGYAFKGWYSDSDYTEIFNHETMPADNVTLYARWSAVDLEDFDTLIINYYRYDDDYSSMNSVWLWPDEPDSGAGERFFWEETTEFGVRLTIDIDGTNLGDATLIGLIVRDDDWNKDIDTERFIDVYEMKEKGTLEIFLIQADGEVYYYIEDVPQ